MKTTNISEDANTLTTKGDINALYEYNNKNVWGDTNRYIPYDMNTSLHIYEGCEHIFTHVQGVTSIMFTIWIHINKFMRDVNTYDMSQRLWVQYLQLTGGIWRHFLHYPGVNEDIF